MIMLREISESRRNSRSTEATTLINSQQKPIAKIHHQRRLGTQPMSGISPTLVPHDLVLVGDYCQHPPLVEWNKGLLPLCPIAESTLGLVRVFAMCDIYGGKYWEIPGSEGYAAKVAEGLWLPQIVANDLQMRILSDGEDSVPLEMFIEEVYNHDDGESLLVITHFLSMCRSIFISDNERPFLFTGCRRHAPRTETLRILGHAQRQAHKGYEHHQEILHDPCLPVQYEEDRHQVLPKRSSRRILEDVV
jgi:hypothetical protein